MATFLSTQNMRVQEHFEVLEIDLPIISGTCTIGTKQGTGTPLTCDQKWAIADGGQSEYKTYYFTNENAPLLPSINGEPIWRCIKSINETATELKPGEGLSGRSSLSVVLADFTNQDPNADNIPTGVKEQGTYLGKLDARQIFENKAARLKLYRVQEDGSVDLTDGAQTRSYLTSTMSSNENGTWSFKFKDLLSLVNLGEKSWPITKGGFIQLDIDASQNTITVDDVVTYTALDFLRIGDEFFQVVSINQTTPTAPVLTVTTRGGDMIAPTSGVLLTTTSATTHSAGDEVFICDLSDNETIDGLLTRVLVESDFPSALIPATDWAAEVLEWHSTDRINTLHSESEDVNSVINRIITGYLMNLWFDPIGTATYPSGQARLSAISVWKQSTASLTEGKEINAYTVKKVAKEQLRATRALILYDKRNLAESNDTSNFKKGSQFSDNTLIGPELFTKHKDKIFEANSIIDKDAADLVTQRYVSQYKFPPYERTFITDERHLIFKTGDVVDLLTSADQSPYGLTSGNIRGQITKINPSYQDGRKYNVKALTYEAAFTTGSEIVLNSPLSSVNLFVQAGAPSSSVNLTFVLDGTYSHGDLSIISGAFHSGTTLNIILANGFDGQATGGDGGTGGSGTNGSAGANGGVVFTGNTGITVNIYFSGDTSAISTAYPVADGYIRAPGGGGGGGGSDENENVLGGGGGGGGSGRSYGFGALGGSGTGSSFNNGLSGSNGDILGTGGSGGTGGGTGGNGGAWGQNGQAGTNSLTSGGGAGLAGSGIINNGATINLIFDASDPVPEADRYINGNGSHP
jgi:hypothetical protein